MPFKLYTSLSQRLVLTPQLKQRIDMLAMTKMELVEAINRELQENPVLDETVEAAPPSDQSLMRTEDDVPAAPTTIEAPASEPTTPEATADPFAEIDYGSFFQDYLDPGYRTSQSYEDREDEPSLLEKLTPNRTALADYLMEQWQFLTPMAQDLRDIAEAIIGNLNEDGYLEATLEEIMSMGGWPIPSVEATLSVIQGMDPAGVGARDLRECLLIQLRRENQENRLAYRLVSEHLGDLHQRHRLPELAKSLGVTLETLLSEMEVIRSLEPCPGRNYAAVRPQYIAPEVAIVKVGAQYKIVFNDDGLPHLRLNSSYRRLLESNGLSKEARDFIKEKLRSAIELLKNVEHRKRAIYRVCEAMVRRQSEFLEMGMEHLRPMLLKDIAEELSLSLSTISRVVNHKYVETPQGIMELRRFFTEGTTRNDGEEISTRVIKLQIKRLIESEDPHAPLTDDDIVQVLDREGIKLSRRTITKYRKQMVIPSSRDRRALPI